MDERDFRRLAKEHAANVQAYMDAGLRVVGTMGRLAGVIENEIGAPIEGGAIFTKCDQAAALVGQAFHAVRNALEMD